jgi:hypothetical protein
MRRDHAEAHAVLQRVAKAIYEQTEEPTRLFGDEIDPDVALELDLLDSGTDGVAFSNPDVRRDYLVRHTAELALGAWDDPVAFTNIIDDAQYRTLDFGTRREVTTVVLLVLARDHDKDVVGRMGEVARLRFGGEDRNDLFWGLYHPFCEALPELSIEPHELADALEAVFEATSNDLTGGFVYGVVEKLAARSRVDAEALYEAFVSRPDSPAASFSANALLGLANFDLPEAHRRALDLTDSEQPTLRRAGIAALGRLDYAGGERPDLLAATWERLEALKATQDPEIGQALTRAYGNLIGQKPEATEALVELSARPDPSTQHQVAAILSMQGDEACGEPWYRSALLRLARVPMSHAGTWRELDHCASDTAKGDPELAVEFMEAVVVGRDYGARGEEGDLPEMLGSTFSELMVNRPETFSAAVTRWFASDERRLHRAARDVVSHHQSRTIDGGSPWPRLSKPVLDGLDEQTVAYALQRIMGHITVGGHYLAALLLSAVRRESCSPDFLNFVAWALGEHVLYNFPGEAGDYLRGRVDADDTSETEREVAQAALDHSEGYFEKLRNLPRLEEFKPPSRRLYPLRLAHLKQQAAISEAADQRSVLASLFPKIPLKYGRSFFMEQDGEYTEPSELGEYSVGMDLPRGELIDPVGQQIQRLHWQSAGLKEDEDSAQDEPDEDAEA